MQLCRANGESLWEFFKKNKITYEKSDFPFLTDGEVPSIKSVADFGEYLGLVGRGEATSFLYRTLGRSLTYIGAALDTEREYGFNDHTDRHTLWVAGRCTELLQRGGRSADGKGVFDRKSEILCTLVGMTHDIGNLISRKMHSKYSMEILDELFGWTGKKNYREIWEVVRQAVLYHDEAALNEGGFAIEKGYPLLWALVIADKMHFGRDRLGEKTFETGEEGAAEKDVHIALEMLVARSTWYLNPDEFVWHLDFSVELGQEWMGSLANHKDRVWVPKLYQQAYRQNGQEYRVTFAKQFLEVYGERVKLIERAAKVLFPWIKGFAVELVDSDSRDKVTPAKMQIYTN